MRDTSLDLALFGQDCFPFSRKGLQKIGAKMMSTSRGGGERLKILEMQAEGIEKYQKFCGRHLSMAPCLTSRGSASRKGTERRDNNVNDRPALRSPDRGQCGRLTDCMHRSGRRRHEVLFALGGAEEGRKKADKVHILLWAKANQSDSIAQQVLSFQTFLWWFRY